MEEKIECKICGRKFKQIHHRHVKQHGLTIDEYKKQFPDAPINSEASSQRRSDSITGREFTWANKISESNKQSWKNNPNQGRTGVPLSEDSKKQLSEKLMGHYVSKETRVKISLSGLGRTPWNKGLTKADDERLVSVSNKIREWNKEHMTPEMRQKISQTLKQKYAAGMKIPQAKSNWRTDLQHYFRSTWEANYARVLNYNQTTWTYEQHRFRLTDDSGDIIAVYTPDFFIDKHIEIKGHADAADDWECDCRRCDRDRMKMLLFSEQYPEEEIEIIGKKEYRDIATKYASIIDNWEVTSYDP